MFKIYASNFIHATVFDPFSDDEQNPTLRDKRSEKISLCKSNVVVSLLVYTFLSVSFSSFTEYDTRETPNIEI